MRPPATRYFPYARITGSLRRGHARRNTEALVSHLLDLAAGTCSRDPAEQSVEWMWRLLEIAQSGPPGAGAARTPRIVEVAELLGGPPPWLASKVRAWLAHGDVPSIALLRSLLVNVRTVEDDWRELRQVGLDACLRAPQLIEDTVLSCRSFGIVDELAFFDQRWREESIDGLPATLWLCDLRVAWPSGTITTSRGYGGDRQDARFAAMLRFLAEAADLDLPSVAPFGLPAAYRCMIADSPHLVGGLSDDGLGIAAAHLDDVHAPPESLLAELSRRVAAERVSSEVAATILHAVPEEIGRASPGWRELVEAVATAAATRPEFALGLLDAGTRRDAWSLRPAIGRPTVLHRGQVVAPDLAPEPADAWAQAVIGTICANLVRGMQPPQVERAGLG